MTEEQRERRRERFRRWYATHREYVLAKVREYTTAHHEAAKTRARVWHQTHPELAKARAAERYRSHRDEVKVRMQAWREANRDYVTEMQRRYRLDNTETVRQRDREYYALNREKFSAKKGRRRARLAGVLSTLTADQWEEILEFFEHRCAYCGAKPKKLQRDHFIPLARSGDHTAENILPACPPCNQTKGTKTIEEWLS